MRAWKAINWSKALSVMVLMVLMLAYPGWSSSLRPCVYLALHGSYLAWWGLHQWLVPGWAAACFSKEMSRGGVAFVLLTVGLAYMLPALAAFRNPHPLSPLKAALWIFLYSLGSFTNIAADLYKAGAKDAGAVGPLSKGPFARFAHLHWAGDWARYSAFAATSGHPLSFLLPLYVVAINMHSKVLYDAAQQSARNAKLAEKSD
jgi:hypothetical protein